MYYAFFGLRENPFTMTSDPKYLFLTPQHNEALAGLTYAILNRKGFVVLTGEAGTGKTTMLARVLERVPTRLVQSSVILNPTLTAAEFLEMALLDFGISDVPASKAQRLAKLQAFLLKGHREGKISALIVDEAHKLSPDVLEELRLLGNFDLADQKLLQILLIGQDELTGVLNRPDMRQLKQRIAVRLSIAPLEPADVEPYIRERWTTAGGALPAPFSPDAIAAIARWSRGIPRVINAVCDNALLLAFAEQQAYVGAGHVLEAATDLDLVRSAPPAAAGAQSAEAAPAAILSFPTLERYGAAPAENQVPAKPSIVARWFRKVSFVH